jgi:hypothetical protein
MFQKYIDFHVTFASLPKYYVHEKATQRNRPNQLQHLLYNICHTTSIRIIDIRI